MIRTTSNFNYMINFLFDLPGLILSGLYPKKSLLNFNFENFSITGIQYSSVQPGNTVDSKIITEPFLIILPNNLQASCRLLKSGRFFIFTGVGTVTINTLQFSN